MKFPILDALLCTAGVFSVAATVAVYAGPSPDLQSLEKNAAQSSGVVMDDAMISSKVLRVLGADPQASPLRIAVDTREGIVSLAGAVPSADVSAHVIQLVSAVEGVRGVRNSLRIEAAG